MEFESTSAVNTVFAVTELLENILLGLPCHTLLLAQRTCKAWRDTINHSNDIQKALCFKTVGLFDNAHHSKGIAPMLLNNFDRPMLVDVTSAREYLSCVVLNRYHVNPLLKVFFEEAELEPEHLLDFIVPIKQDPVLYQKAMQQMVAEYYRWREEEEN